jgi:glycine/serine hydroxymethyltransferase
MGEPQMLEIASLIGAALNHRDDEAELSQIREQVFELCASFPPYPTLVPGNSAGRV